MLSVGVEGEDVRVWSEGVWSVKVGECVECEGVRMCGV